MDEQVLGEVELLRYAVQLVQIPSIDFIKKKGRGHRHAFLMWLFHFWAPTRTFTVFCMRPAETTTAFICREAEAASFWVDIAAGVRLLTQLCAVWDEMCVLGDA